MEKKTGTKKAGIDVYDNCKDCDVLRESLDASQRELFDRFNAEKKNTKRCSSMAYAVMLNIMTNNTVGIRHQLATLSSCGDCELNHKLAKISSKVDDIGETEGVNYYRTWVEEDIWKLIPWRKRYTLYHEVNKAWFYPTVAALVGVSPIVYKSRSPMK